MHSMMVIITGLAMGITVLIGQQFGRGEPEKVGQTVESGVFLFGRPGDHPDRCHVGRDAGIGYVNAGAG